MSLPIFRPRAVFVLPAPRVPEAVPDGPSFTSALEIAVRLTFRRGGMLIPELGSTVRLGVTVGLLEAGCERAVADAEGLSSVLQSADGILWLTQRRPMSGGGKDLQSR